MEQVHAKILSRVALKKPKCPDCSESLGSPSLDAGDQVVRVVCKKGDCGYSVDLMWIGAAASNSN